MYVDRLIRILKEKVIEMTDIQKKSVINIASMCMRDSNNIIVPIENNSIRVMHINDILYIIQPKKGFIIIGTEKEEIEYRSNAFDLLEYVEKRNKSFRYLNNNLIVDINRISYYNSFYRKIYFQNNIELNVTGKAMDNIIKKEISKERDGYYTFSGKFESI